ncbi:MAG TPA: glutaredoxin family protein [Candidatus Dormibacteraeota bacterium]|jgi:glutaredoxin
MRVELVTRHGCHLCEEAEALLRGSGVKVGLLDVDADPELHRLYDFRVPVLLLDGRLIGEGSIGPAALAAIPAEELGESSSKGPSNRSLC